MGVKRNLIVKSTYFSLKVTQRITFSAQHILSQVNFAAHSTHFRITLLVDTPITVDYLTAIVRSTDQLDFLCVPCKFSNMLSEINLRDQKVDTLSELDHLDYFSSVSRNLQSHTTTQIKFDRLCGTC